MSAPEAPRAIGPEVAAWVRDVCHPNLFWRHLGIEITHLEQGYARVRCPAGPTTLNTPQGPVHGGVTAAVLDSAAAAAVLATRRPDDGLNQGTLDLNITYLEPGREGELTAEARVVRRGRTAVVVQGEVWDGTGRRIATGRCTYLLWPQRT